MFLTRRSGTKPAASGCCVPVRVVHVVRSCLFFSPSWSLSGSKALLLPAGPTKELPLSLLAYAPLIFGRILGVIVLCGVVSCTHQRMENLPFRCFVAIRDMTRYNDRKKYKNHRPGFPFVCVCGSDTR